ncbi:SusD/RagB family nutrient-binding outer membrane lipoprotein [Sphingobacterium spiritivorum]|uniref:SusD/RagB family nutrient-binding outer membrane lipoprotein n=1 Tax=Sphingobacterium spiritivorum TaxID=258 RepID=UPI003DA21587
MKNIKSDYKVCCLLLFVIVAAFSCTKNYADYNTNPALATLEQQNADKYISGKNFPAMINAVLPAGDPPGGGGNEYANSYQVAFNLAADCYSGFMAQAGDWNGNTNNLTYGFNLGWVNEQFALTGKLMAGWKNIKDITDASGDSLQFSVAQIIKVIGIIKTTDSYGPIPYSSILTESSAPAYDSQESIYTSAFQDLVKARNILYKNGASAGSPLRPYDLIYAGDYLKWAKLANSLLLRYAMRIVYADPAKAKQIAEEAVSNPAGLLTNPADNALQSLKPGNGTFNYYNPLVTLVGYQEARANASMQCVLTGYKDPRISVYYKLSNLEGRKSEYVGIRSGINITRVLYEPFSSLNITTTTPMPWMLASEIYFLRAEGAIRGWSMGGTAKDLYETGISTSFSEKGATLPSDYLSDDVSVPKNYIDYVTSSNNSSMDYATSQATTTVNKWTIKWDDAANFETKLHRIVMQKWIALYLNGPEAWAEYRRTGYPRLLPISLNRSGGVVSSTFQVRRLPYPAAQYNKNAEQTSKAITLLGGPDNGATRLWWDKKANIPKQ